MMYTHECGVRHNNLGSQVFGIVQTNSTLRIGEYKFGICNNKNSIINRMLSVKWKHVCIDSKNVCVSLAYMHAEKITMQIWF